MQRAFQGPPTERQLTDYGAMEMATMAVLMSALLALGLYPQPLLDLTQPIVEQIVASNPATIVEAGL
jgi:NADH-quinone oxidoreductase subunit M